jgi:hypothetical protein
MKAIGVDMGEYGEAYRGFALQVAVEQVMTGVKLHFRVLRDGLVVRDWRLVPFDRLWATERQAAQAAFAAARALVDRELAA